ncbi:MAG TPA: alpha/beta fold hydrolase [Paenalcaligenes sp.]|nr:alpha/beta fold hydrolase [Paenalcaligenes sp.]
MNQKTNQSQSFEPLIDLQAAQSIQQDFIQKWGELCAQAQSGSLGPLRSRRFRGDAWAQNPVALFQAHAWQLYANTLQQLAHITTQSKAVQERLAFYSMQWAEMWSPANFLATNPESQKKFFDSQGQSLLKGLQNFLGDIQKGRLTQVDEQAFEVGKNLAITQGAVIFQNELMQLIQYSPSTQEVHERPLLIVPPCINKYYILDLQPENSFVKYAVDQGHTVFLISWRNPMPQDDDGIRYATWGDYIEHGVLRAIEITQEITGQTELNTLGFCVGGTLLSSALSIAKARNSSPSHSLTLLTSMLDFHDVGVMDVFVDEATTQSFEWQLADGRLMGAAQLANTFSMLRPSELVWNYVTSNYLEGETPPAFDILYWNSDGTNLPGSFFTWYFRNTYLENNLAVPGKITVDGTPIDFTVLDMPAYIYGSKEDHIVPWETAFASVRQVSGPRRFVLGASGHVAGVINPPAANRRHYWAYEDDDELKKHAVPEKWLAHAPKHDGSWWSDWSQWLSKQGGKMTPAPKTLGNDKYTVLEAAPGSYVKQRAL